MLTSLEGARILLVEDHDSLREDLQAILESEGYQVKAAASGLEALELASQHTFELVISDVRMAGMDGLEAIERLQKHYGHVATLVITGYAADTDSIRAVRLGVGDYLKKPFELVDFVSVVARLLRNFRQEQLRRQSESNLRKTATWALERLYLSRHPMVEPPTQPRLAQALAQELGLASEPSWHSQVLTWLQLCQQLGALPTDDLPDDIKNLLQEFSEGEESLSLPAQIARLSLSGEAASSEALRPTPAFRLDLWCRR
jgi:CheY-like chemotaxis protein